MARNPCRPWLGYFLTWPFVMAGSSDILRQS
jgi:hypothetical protein